VTLTQERVSVYWGEYSQVAAILTLIRETFSQSPALDYLVLLSGSDYPLASSSHIAEFLRSSRGVEFINATRMPNDRLGKSMSRLTEYLPRSDRAVQRLIRLPVRYAQRVGWPLPGTTRNPHKYLNQLIPHGGSTWWALTAAACRHILNFVERSPKLMQFFENTRNPDETVIQTIMCNSRFRENIRHNLTYADWGSGDPSPAVLTREHIAQLTSQPQIVVTDSYGSGRLLFARKFPDDSVHLTDIVDAWIRDNE
jgi:hypothetical protein